MEKDEKHSKWSCSKCTYLNYFSALRCCMCNYKRLAVEKFSKSALIPIKSTINDDPCDFDNKHDSQYLLCNTSHSLIDEVKKLEIQASNLDLSYNLNPDSADLASSSNISSKLDSVDLDQKWQCLICTYENYPRSSKCVMCATRKQTISSTQEIISNENDYIDSEYDENLACGASNYNNTSSSSSTMLDDNYTAKNNLKNLPHNNNKHQINTNELEGHQERRIRQIKRQADWIWLNAVNGVVENDLSAVEKFLSMGGNVARALTKTEVEMLNRPSAFDVGYTLIHLAIRFHRDELLSRLLAQINSGPSGIKCVGENVAPDIAADIRRHFAQILRIRKIPFNCSYVNEHATFFLPADIEELPIAIQEQLYDELLDRDAQKQLENPPPALNWSIEITSRLGSRLMVLWNRSAGDCLLDSLLQASWGVFDRDNLLRRALSDSLHQCSPLFYARWKEYEMAYHQAAMLHFTLEEQQWEEDWKNLKALASQPGASLEQLHIFVLCHIFRRPIIVFGVKYVKSYRTNQALSPARFEGLYLPLLWEQSFCIKSPLALGYTRGHFSALVPSESYQRLDSAREEEDVTYLPLFDCHNKLIPIHFLSQAEVGNEEKIMRSWLDVCFTEGGLMVAQQKLQKRPLLVAQMLEEWLNYYRRKAQIISPVIRAPQMIGLEGYLSDGDTDEE